MRLAVIDWAIMAVYFILSLVIGLVVTRFSSKDSTSFFLGGRQMPWWLLGVSLVATTFSTDTPNLVTDLVRNHGTFGNWTWWAFLLTGTLTVFLYAKLWRRSEVLTDVEFYEIRYSGKPAAFLRGFRAVYLGVFFNITIMAAVTLAAIKIGGVMLGLTPLQTVVIAASVTMVYSALGGYLSVLLTDLFQFGVAMIGSVLAAIYVVNLPEVGGLDSLLAHPSVQGYLAFWPQFDHLSWDVLLPVFVIPLAVQWWAAYYPGSEPGGGSYVVQRMLSAKNEKHAVSATLLFNAMHYALRPWPWILVALASLIVFPSLDSLRVLFPSLPEHVIRHDLAYSAMLTFLPAGLLGVVVTSLVAAYMSTMSSQVNWGSSVVVNDVYHRFINPEASEQKLVWVGRLSTVVLMVVSCTLALFLQNALQMFEVLLQIGAGTGLLLLLRWFWWRINAYSELTAMLVSFLVAVYFQFFVGQSLPAWEKLLIGVGITTVSWLVATFATRPTDDRVLYDFYRKIQPGGAGWKPVLEKARREGIELESGVATNLPYALLCALFATLAIYCTLFATGFFIYGNYVGGTVCALIALAAGGGLVVFWPRLSFEPASSLTRMS